MKIQGQLIDSGTAAGIPSASVQVLDSSGNPMNIGTVADADGYYELSSTALDNNANLVAFSAAGYIDMQVSPNQANVPATVLYRADDPLAPVLVTAKMAIAKVKANWPVYAGIGVASIGIGYFLFWLLHRHKVR